MKAISEETWMKAAKRGFRNPNTAKPTPMLSTTSVRTKFCMIVRRQRRAIERVSTSYSSSPSQMKEHESLAHLPSQGKHVENR
jgi:hypothetical protein